ncbi:MAG: hypothetical protein ACOYL8_00240 [Patescibacteria group bacterium]
MESLKESFVSNENHKFKYRFGKVLASSLSGFLTGIIGTIIFFLAFFDVALKQ